MSKPIISSIKQTLAYFDIFDYPLTVPELGNFLWDCPVVESADYFYSILDEMIKMGMVGQMNGFYFLSGREKIVEIRLNRALLIEKKMNIALRAIKLISMIPFVRAVFVCNTLAAGWPNDDSDIDLFIVTASKRIWFGRVLVTVLMSIMNLRRGQKKITDRVCLSFYITEDNLDLAQIAIDSPDIYLVYWLLQLVPVYGGQEYYQKVMAKNLWINDFVKNNFQNYHPLPIWETKLNKFQQLARNAFENIFFGRFGDLANNLFKKIQLKKIASNVDVSTRPSGKGVVINDQMLKFHENDRRGLYREMWVKRCGEITN